MMAANSSTRDKIKKTKERESAEERKKERKKARNK
jgi:hypothetical protein